MGRHGNVDVQKAFKEFQDDENPTKCNKVRCVHCGFVRAKNTTRQVEHLQDCSAYLNSQQQQQQEQQQSSQQPTPQPPPGHMNASHNGSTNPSPTMNNSPAHVTPTPGQKNFLMGQRPNPNLMGTRRPSNKRTIDGNIKQNGRPPMGRPMPPPPVAPAPVPVAAHAPAPPAQAPSLANYLLTRDPGAFSSATQQPFLSHAGCGTLSAGALGQWLAQDSHISRGYISFVGQLIGKIKLPAVQNSQLHPLYRTMDLLISALNNARREMSFFEVTATKYNLQLVREEPSPITKAYLDLFVASSSPSASLLEGMVVLWATQHCYRSSWTYSSTFTSTLNQPILPSFSVNTDSHNAALHQSLIPNWTSPAFAKFVDACRAVVDELANAQTSGNGREEMARCECAWKQVLWLWEQSWPEVDGMGEEEESVSVDRFGNSMKIMSSAGHGGSSVVNHPTATAVAMSTGPPAPNVAAGAMHERDAEAADDDDDDDDEEDVVEVVGGRRESGLVGSPSYVSPYGGTGLQAVEAATHV
ncbi:hypothetical protein AAFC00_000479 [Neodothiora populina]|uniref:Thiaminase-2/PQQC domain-containing protein n=1 Tax=Neodothiora populina TaxID=2781224 RepID=A0ABR3PD99_9PEZI